MHRYGVTWDARSDDGGESMLTLVTVCFNNPEELEKTVASVSLQTVQPDDYVIVDSSDSDISPRMKRIAENAPARYVWVPPEGVYQAMRHSVTLVDDESWVWWINSSDWLAGKKSIEIVTDAISEVDASPDIHWIVGELLRLANPIPSVHPVGSTGKDFLQMLQTGKTGFPHPSTVFRKKSLVTVAPYEDRFAIASDYATALRFDKAFGPPLLLTSSLAVHDPTGLTSRYPAKNLWERSRARIATGSALDAVSELWRLPRSVIRGVLTRLIGEKPVQRDGNRRDHFPLRGNEPFDSESEAGRSLNFTP